jgi:hypothetical protein
MSNVTIWANLLSMIVQGKHGFYSHANIGWSKSLCAPDEYNTEIYK